MEKLEAIVLKLQNPNWENMSIVNKNWGKGQQMPEIDKKSFPVKRINCTQVLILPEIPRPFLTWQKDFSSLTITPTHFPFVVQD